MPRFLYLIVLIFSFNSYAITKNVMAPLLVQDFQSFEAQLHEVKALGADAVSTDVWWGLVEPQDNQFDWSYYQKLSDLIIKAGLKWVPILSTHQCGGNVGDTVNVPIPSWIWSKYAGQDIQYKSEQGNYSQEVIAAYATPIVLQEYKDLFQSFKQAFAAKAQHIQEINVSLGPAGELRYPSYNSHDQGTGYPTRGALQSYSNRAVNQFREYIQFKYQSLSALNNAWGFNLKDWSDVNVPTPSLFFTNGEQNTQYGYDFYDWYSFALRDHGRLILTEAIAIFRSLNLKIGAKLPGIHWRIANFSDRLAELNAGLIDARKSNWSGPNGYGYNKMIEMFVQLKRQNNFNDYILHFTCLEKDNLEDGSHANSFAKALVFWMAEVAERKSVEIKGENALAGPMQSSRSWNNIQNAFNYSSYTGVTILRMGDVLKSQVSRDGFRNLK